MSTLISQPFTSSSPESVLVANSSSSSETGSLNIPDSDKNETDQENTSSKTHSSNYSNSGSTVQTTQTQFQTNQQLLNLEGIASLETGITIENENVRFQEPTELHSDTDGIQSIRTSNSRRPSNNRKRICLLMKTFSLASLILMIFELGLFFGIYFFLIRNLDEVYFLNREYSIR